MTFEKTISALDAYFLLAGLKVGPEATIQGIAAALSEAKGQPVSVGGLYVVMQRARDRGWVIETSIEPEAKQGGRRKSGFTITDRGRNVVTVYLKDLDALREGTVYAYRPRSSHTD